MTARPAPHFLNSRDLGAKCVKMSNDGSKFAQSKFAQSHSAAPARVGHSHPAKMHFAGLRVANGNTALRLNATDTGVDGELRSERSAVEPVLSALPQSQLLRRASQGGQNA
jgi:hypothetical protein